MIGFFDSMARDLRYALHSLSRRPAFTFAAVLTLALGIGATSAVFTLVHRVVLNPLPYRNSDRLIELEHAALGLRRSSGLAMTLGLFYDYLDRARTIDGISLFDQHEATLTGEGAPERINITRATAPLASVLGVSPELGRWFTGEESAPGGPRVAVLSHRLWIRRYGGDPAILDRSLTLDGLPTVVVGVMPRGFSFPDSGVDAWVPMQMARTMTFGDWIYTGVARLRDGVTLTDARRELNALIASLPDLYPDDPVTSRLIDPLQVRSVARTLKEVMVGDVERALWILLASVGVVLLVACVNVANLFLVRWEARQREVAVRRALGADGGGIARMFLAESMLLSLAGGLVGLALAWGAAKLLTAVAPANLPRLDEIRLDGTVLAFAFTLSLLTALAFGSMPLWRGTPMAVALHDGGRSHTVSRTRYRVRHLLMGGQVALTLMLLVASGLMIKSFQRLLAIDPGFEASSALTFSIALPDLEYPDRPALVAAHQAILDRLSAIPGVTSVSASTRVPFDETGMNFPSAMRVEGKPAPGPGDTVPPTVSFRAVAGGYFETMGTRLLRGRGIDRNDVERRNPVAVVNEALVNTFFPNQDPIGSRVARGISGGSSSDWLTVVGVVSNTPVFALTEATQTNARPKLYMPMSISGPPAAPGGITNGPLVAAMTYVVRSATPPLGLLPAIRRGIDTVDSTLPIAHVSTLEDRLERASAPMAFTMVLLVIAAAMALMIGLIGIYGVVSYIVSQRTNEIGVRLALGAEPGRVVGLIVSQSGVVALAGIMIGLAAALAGSRLVESLLYDVSPRDPMVFALTTLMLLGIAGLACALSARRAARVSPVEALRAD